MTIETELDVRPDNDVSNDWLDRGVEDYVRIRCRGRTMLPGGTKITVESRKHGSIPRDMPERIDAAYRKLQDAVKNDIRFLGASAVKVEIEDRRGEDGGDLDHVREQLLSQSHGDAVAVFALIDRLADAGDRLSWSKHPKLGIRGSVTGTAPRICRTASGPDFEIDDADWETEGDADCLCVLAVNHELASTAADDERGNGPSVHYAPMPEARRLAAGAKTAEAAPAEFTFETAPWGLLAAASDEADVDDWIDDNLPNASSTEIRQMRSTYWSIRSWLEMKLAPQFAETVYMDAPGSLPMPDGADGDATAQEA